MNKNQQKKYDQAVKKADQFFIKKNYQLAKVHFDTMLRLNPDLKTDNGFSEKRQLCHQEEILRLRKEGIKKGRNYEKKNKLSLALECFEQAFAIEKEDWLENKISQLKETLTQSQVADLISDTQLNDDPQAQLDNYSKLLASEPNNILLQKKMAQCFVKLEQYERAITLFLSISEQEQGQGQEPFSESDAYYWGYAYLQSNNLLLGLLQWSHIKPPHAQAENIYGQVKALLPFAIEALKNSPEQEDIIKALYDYVCLFEPLLEPLLEQEGSDHNDLQNLYIQQLWKAHQYKNIHSIISSFPENISLEQLELYSKLYLKLSMEDDGDEFLEDTINFWLSAIYNEKLLYSLCSVQENEAEIDIFALQNQLLLKLEVIINRLEKKKCLAEQTKTLWEVQRGIVQLLSKLQNKSKSFKKNLNIEFFPCTPIFAKKFAINDSIYQLLLANRRYLMGKHNQFSEDQYYECCAYFSPLSDDMIAAIHENELDALKSLSKHSYSNSDDKDLLDYCQQKIAFQYAFRILSQRKNSKQVASAKLSKYFLQALPLIKKYPEYSDKLATLSLSDLDPIERYVHLSNIMEILVKDIKDTKFLQATAFSMMMKAIYFHKSHTSIKVIQKLLLKAQSFDPDSYLVKEALDGIQFQMLFERFDHALDKGNTFQAASIVQESGSKELESSFFGFIEMSVSMAAFEFEDKDELAMAFNELYINCCRIDKNHPVTIKLGKQIEEFK